MIGVSNTKTPKSGQRSILTDRSSMAELVLAYKSIFKSLAINKAIRLPDYCSVFRKYVINWLETNRQSVSDVCILSGSPSGTGLASHYVEVSPHLPHIEDIATQMNICLCWIQGHRETVRLMSLQGKVLLQNYNPYTTMAYP